MTRRFDLDDDVMGYALGTGPLGCNVTKHWMEPNDLEQHWQKHRRDPILLGYLDQQGWSDPRAIEYRLNSHGFRGVDFQGQYDAIALGCSYTFGHALSESQTWPWLVGQKCSIRVANLGINGVGSGGCFRALRYWISRLKPRWVLVLMPHHSRVEVVISEDSDRMYVETYVAGHDHDGSKFLRDYWFTDYNGLLDRERTILGLQRLTEINNSRMVLLTAEEAERRFWDDKDLARDFAHPGPIFQKRVADFFIEQMQRDHGQD